LSFGLELFQLSQSSIYFAETYEANRAKFRALLSVVQKLWPSAEPGKHQICAEEDLSIDTIEARPRHNCKRLVIISTGLHGIEGYIGAAAQHLFVAEHIGQLTPENTGLLLIHAINPWGMKYHRRVNENNVDLNRNFLFEDPGSAEEVNPAYNRALKLLNPTKPLRSAGSPFFYLCLINKMLTMGPAIFREAVLYGQYRYPYGLYYGGSGFELSAKVVNDLYATAARDYQRILHIDMHSGYGPRDQMTLVNSVYEKRDSADLQKSFDYPLVAKTDPDEFYQMQGDMVDYLYQYFNSRHPNKYYYGTSFEFGTYGESFSAVVRSLKAMINENRYFHYGAVSERAELQAKKEFEELFNPQDEDWRKKTMQDSRRAFTGILRAEGFLD
jgi:hypothetical protein